MQAHGRGASLTVVSVSVVGDGLGTSNWVPTLDVILLNSSMFIPVTVQLRSFAAIL
jgi:hypothetical protein